jgi:hypothetical protein
LEQPDLRATRVFKELQVLRVRWARKVLLDPLVTQGRLDLLVQLEQLDLLGHKVRWDHRVHKVFREKSDQLDRRVHPSIC